MNNLYKLADLEIDPNMRTVMRAGQRIDLPELSFKLLTALTHAAPHPLSVQQLAQQVWALDVVTEETIAQRISLLRRALGDDPKAPKYIRTVRGAGYSIATTANKIALNAKPQEKSIRPKWQYVGAAAAVIIAIGALSWSFFPNTQTTIQTPPNPSMGERAPVHLLIERATVLLNVQQADETDRGIIMLQEGIKTYGENADLKVALSFALATRATKFQQQEGDVEMAEQYAREALKNAPEMPQAWHALGYALDARGQIDQAIAAYQRCNSIDPNNANALSSAAYLFAIRGRYHEALKLDVRGIKNGGSARYVEIQIANTLDALNLDTAQSWYDRAEQLNPGQTVIIAELAERALSSGQYQQALEIITRIPENELLSPRLINALGRAQFMLGNELGARSTLNKGSSAASQLFLAAIDAQSGDTSQAKTLINNVEKGFASGNSWPISRIQLAELKAAMGQDKDAIQLLSQAVDLGWRNAAYIQTSPFLGHLTQNPSWTEIERRLNNEIAAQLSLVMNDDDLAYLIK